MRYRGFYITLLIGMATLISCHSLSSDEKGVNEFPMYISAEQALEDLQTLTHVIENKVPNAFRNTEREKYEVIKKNLVSHFEDSISVQSLYQKLYPLIIQLHDAHFSLNYSDAYLEKFKVLLFPITVYVHDERLFVLNDPAESPVFKLGEEILYINGVSSSEILKSIRATNDLERSYAQFLERRLEAVFPHRLHAVMGMSGEFTIVTNDTALKIKGLRASEIHTQSGPEYLFETYYGDVAYLKVGTLTHHVDSLKMWLERDFSKIKTLGISQLIIDIRGNLGGSSVQAKMILDYIYNRPYTMAIGMAYYKKGNIFYTTNDLDAHQPEELDNRFKGQVVLLSDVLTYSSAHMMQVAFQYFNMGITIGQKSAEMLDVSGELSTYTLPHSRLELRVPTTHFHLPGYIEGIRQYYLPQILIDTFSSGNVLGEDVVKKKAIEMLVSQKD